MPAEIAKEKNYKRSKPCRKVPSCRGQSCTSGQFCQKGSPGADRYPFNHHYCCHSSGTWKKVTDPKECKCTDKDLVLSSIKGAEAVDRCCVNNKWVSSGGGSCTDKIISQLNTNHCKGRMQCYVKGQLCEKGTYAKSGKLRNYCCIPKPSTPDLGPISV